MCGFAVMLGRDRALDMDQALYRMRHRGTGAPIQGRFGNFTMGHVRLPINGLDEQFDQPYRHMGWTFCFVGEIVNFREIAPTARSDIEVLVQRWMSGPQCVREFDGFWSIAALSPFGTLQIVTDFLNKKPVYYRADACAFASEIRGLTHLGPVTPDPVYFGSVRKWGYHVGRHTYAREIQMLPPGSITTVTPAGEVTIDEGFDVVQPDPGVKLRAAIRTAVRRRVQSSDVPLSILLSGGLDSVIMYRLARDFRDDMIICHVKNEGDSLDALDVRHPVIELDSETIWCEHDVLRWNEGPVDLGSVWPQLSMAMAIVTHVAISGDGADELFGGYQRSMEYDSQGSDVFEEIPYYHAPRLDKLMMSGTVELRCPFMGREVLAGALALPWAHRKNKWWLREAFEDLVPYSITQGKKIPLKTPVVRAGGVQRRRELCDLFEKMVGEGMT